MCLLESQVFIFDLYGTLINFGVQHHPFRQLLKWARENGRQVLSDDARTVMTINGDVQAIAQTLSIQPPADLLHHINEQIEAELSSLSLFDDVIPTLNVLGARGIKIGICSNLAQPYGAVIDRLLADFDVELFLSYELGIIKPETHIYQSILKRFNCTAEQCLFVGDTFEADYAGSRAVGMSVLHLVRNCVNERHQISLLIDVLDWEKVKR